MKGFPAIVNAYAAAYSRLDPYIKDKLASHLDVRFLSILIQALEQWRDLEISRRVDEQQGSLQELIRRVREFVEKKQRPPVNWSDPAQRPREDMRHFGSDRGLA